MSLTLEELRSIPTADLIQRHDKEAKNTSVGVRYYLEELARRDQAASTTTMVRLTRWIAGMTVVMALATIVNVALFALK